MTLDVYSDLFPQAEDETSEFVDRVLGSELVSEMCQNPILEVTALFRAVVTVSRPVGGTPSELRSELGFCGCMGPFSPQNVLSRTGNRGP
jgi:hypothetical protein